MVTVRELITPLVSGISPNDMASLKAYLESDAASAAQHASDVYKRQALHRFSLFY